VIDAAVFGSTLHAVVADAQAALPKVREVLEAGRMRVGRLEQIPPSLEDVFVSLTTSRESTLEKAA
jgi:ABC-2 type transport system ATP-binding protein